MFHCKVGIVISLNPLFKDLEAAEVTATSNPADSHLEQPHSIVRLRETELITKEYNRISRRHIVYAMGLKDGPRNNRCVCRAWKIVV